MKSLSLFEEARNFLIDFFPTSTQYLIRAALHVIMAVGFIQGYRIAKRYFRS